MKFGDEIPDEVTSLNYNWFGSCRGYYANSSRATLITLPNRIKSMHECCLNLCSHLVTVNLPATLTLICGKCFYKFYALTSINLRFSLISLGGEYFAHCTAL